MGSLLKAGCIVVALVSSVVFSKTPIQIEILTDDDYPPYSFVDQGQLKGIYIDLVEQAITLLPDDYEVKIVPMPWKRALRNIENGEDFAVLPPYNHSGSRTYINPYSIPLAVESVVTYCHISVDLNAVFTASQAMAEPVRIGINAGYIVLDDKYQEAIDNKRVILQENKSTEANLMKLVKGRIDCYANDKISIEYGLKDHLQDQNKISFDDFILQDFISSQTAHIGYSQVNDAKFPFKQDFIDKMDLAIMQVLKQQKSKSRYHLSFIRSTLCAYK